MTKPMKCREQTEMSFTKRPSANLATCTKETTEKDSTLHQNIKIPTMTFRICSNMMIVSANAPGCLQLSGHFFHFFLCSFREWLCPTRMAERIQVIQVQTSSRPGPEHGRHWSKWKSFGWVDSTKPYKT